ncbi:MAG: gliding motility-associated C-terminal domain-containing protein [Lewinella sp.]|nr:gliding motility-associated C-terminal domain-containing protein [Lewinella sp.]
MRRYWRDGVLTLLLWWVTGATAWAQTPFDCNGRMFRALEEPGGTVFQEISLDPATQAATFTDRHFYPGKSINGIAYRPADNLIYGVLLEAPYVLCRIDANYQLERLAQLPLPPNLLFVSGDISPDERYLVLVGFSVNQPDNLLALVDLQTPGYPTTILPMAKTNPDGRLFCADIAFHPTLNQLFGFEHSEGRLITIDLESGLVDNTTYPIIGDIRGIMPSIFFDGYGRLYGIGSSAATFASNNLYRFDTETGTAELIQPMGREGNQDACSCPFQVELLNRVSSRQAYPCTVLDFEFTFQNRTDRPQTALRLTDTFPTGMTLLDLEPLPFSGEINSGPGSSQLDIRDIELPVGDFTWRFSVQMTEDVALGGVDNRAYLAGVYLRSLTESTTIGSDDPETAAVDDPTHFALRPLAVTFNESAAILCPGDSLRLYSGVTGATAYHWNTGAATAAITIDEPGTYRVTVTTGCAEATGAITVQETPIELDLGPDLTIDRGEAVELAPWILSEAPIRLYFWEEHPAPTLSCLTCPTPVARPLTDAIYQLTIENAWGCRARDELQLTVQDLQIYAPNAFSPNGDHRNDFFFLQSRADYPITVFRVFDHWGGLLYERRDLMTNDARAGWNGRAHDQLLQPGVFVWAAEIRTPDGQTQWVSGDVTLMR